MASEVLEPQQWKVLMARVDSEGFSQKRNGDERCKQGQGQGGRQDRG